MRSRAAVLTAMCLSLVLVVASLSSLNVAIPGLARVTGATASEVHWIVDSYAVVFAALLLPAGAIGDRFGRKGALLGGLTVFGLACLGAAFTDDPTLIMAARIACGVGAAFIMPATLSIITATFPEDERGKAVGTWAGFASAGGILGILGAGALLEGFWYGVVFVGTAVLAAIAIAAVAVSTTTSADGEHVSLDPVGALLSFMAIGALVFGIIEGPGEGWTSAYVITSFTVALVSAVAFVVWELRHDEPLLDPRLFLLRGFGAGSASLMFQFLAVFGFLFVGVQYLQYVRGYSPLTAGLALLPMAVVVIPLARHAPRFAHRLGFKINNGVGLLLIGGGFAVYATLDTNSSYWHLAGGLVLMGLGMGLSASPATEAITESVSAAKQGVASAVNDTSRELGGALGIAILGSIHISGYQSSLDNAVGGLPPEAAKAALDSPAAAFQIAERLGDSGRPFGDAARQAFLDGFTDVSIAAVVLVVLGAAVVAWRGPGRRAAVANHTTPATDDPAVPVKPAGH